MSNEEKTTQQAENVPQNEAAQAETVEETSAVKPEGVAEEQTEEQTAPEAEAEAKAKEELASPAAAVKPEKQPERPAKTTGGAKCDLAKNKTFKFLYYPLLALLVAIMLVFSVIDGVFGYSPSAYGKDFYTSVNAHISALADFPRSVMSPATGQDGNAVGLASARDYLVDTLRAGGFTYMDEQKQGDDDNDTDEVVTTVTDWAGASSGSLEPTVTVQTVTPSADLQRRMGVDKYLVGVELTNVIAAIPSKQSNAGAVIITVRYDSRPDTTGAADNAAFVANVMQALIEYVKSDTSFKNDIVAVFTEDLDCAFGAYSFMDSFKGLNDVVSRARSGINLDAYGNAGTLALTDASAVALDYLNAYTSLKTSAYNSSLVADSISPDLLNKYAVKAFGDIPAVQVAVVGGLDAAQSYLDNAKNMSQAVVRQQSEFVKSFIDGFGNSDKAFAAGEGDNVFFSYFDAGTVSYSYVAAYVIGAILLLLMAGVIAAMAVKKTYSVKNMFKGMGVQLVTVLSALVAMFAAYFLVTLMLTGFGVLPIHAITELRYFNAGILIAAMLISLAASFGFTTLYKKLFRVTSSEVVRGTAMLVALVGAVMSFACPAYSYLTVWLGMLMMIVSLVSVFAQGKFKQAFGIGLDRLYLYAIPVAVCLPLTMSAVSMLMWLLPLVLMPVVMTLFTAMLGVATPYLDRTQKVFDAIAKKLPMRTIRVERTVVERVEDKAKKKKFTEQTVKRIEKEKVPVNYKNYFGVSVIAVIGVIVALFSGGFGVDLGKSLTGYHSYENAIYNDALVYEWSKTAGGTVTQKIAVDDLVAYKFMRYSISDLTWDGTRYVKSVNYNSIITEPTIEKTADGHYEVTTFDGPRSYVTLTIPSASQITKITVKEGSKTESGYDGFVYEFNEVDEIVLRLPYGFGSTMFTLDIEGASPSLFEYEEYRAVTVSGADKALDNVDEWNSFVGNYIGTDDAEKIHGAIVIKSAFSF